MSAVTKPRGRESALVYWYRRFLVLATTFALIFVVFRAFADPADPDAGHQAEPAASEPEVALAPMGPFVPEPETKPAAGETDDAGAEAGTSSGEEAAPGAGSTPAPQPTPSPAPLPQPDGPCKADEISAKPTVAKAVAGDKVLIRVKLTSVSKACTFDVNSGSLAVRVTSGSDAIWSSQDCPKSVKAARVVVRSGKPAIAQVTWHGRRSDRECGKETAWGMPGYYFAHAAVVGSVPGKVQFQLSAPERPVITKTEKQRKRR